MKEFKNEKAIISLTSWKGRINTVYKTIENLLNVCPGFHIVLCLSIDEFPSKEKELPESLTKLIDKIEILWVKENYKSLKKILFTMNKYKEIPVISADDDLIYTFNYAEELYKTWLKNKNKIITIYPTNLGWFTSGPSTLYCPNCFGSNFDIFDCFNKVDYKNYLQADDAFYEFLRMKYFDSGVVCLVHQNIFTVHDEIEPLRNVYSNPNFFHWLRLTQIRDVLGNEFFNRLLNEGHLR